MSEAARGHLAMLIFSALVAGSFSLGALVADQIAPIALNAIRFVIAAALVGAMAWIGPGFRRSDFHAPWRYPLLGGVFAIYFVLMFEGLKTAQPVSTAAVFTLTPIMSAAVAYLMLRQILTGRMAVALAIGGAGALWVIFRADVAALLAFEVRRGEQVFFLGCIAHAVYTPLVRFLNRGETALVFSFGTVTGGAVVMLVLGWRTVLETPWMLLPAIVWVTLFYVAIFASAVTFVLVQYATLRLPASKVMAYTYLTPSWVILWEIALGHGMPPVWVLAGVALTCMALWMLLKNES